MQNTDPQTRILEALSEAQDPAVHWQRFMALVHELAPNVFSPGRPSAADIEHSFIGQAGFKSWRAMVEAPRSEGGLEWSWSTWRQWSRAWAAIQASPGLDGAFTPAQVNRVSEQCRRAGVPVPALPEGVEAILDRSTSLPSPSTPKTPQGVPEGRTRLFKMLVNWLIALFRR
jgi:hypothetical protein